MVNSRLSLLSSQKGNHYFLNPAVPQVLLLHPAMKIILEKALAGEEVKKWIDEIDEKDAVFRDNRITRQTLIYYFGYYLFLEKNGYLKEINTIEMQDEIYSADDIIHYMANTEQIVFEVTDACNLNCKYCGYGELYTGYDKRYDKNLSPETAKRIFDFVFQLKESEKNQSMFKRFAVGFYGGEPLLNFSFIKDMVSYVGMKKKARNEILFNMTTNGILLHKYIDFLVAHDFFLLISLDGDKENNGYRVDKQGINRFDIVEKNITKIKEKYPAYYKSKVMFSAVLHNKNSAKQIKEYFKKNHGKDPLLNQLSMVGVRPEKEKDFHEMYNQMFSELTDKDIRSFRRDRKNIQTAPGTQLVQDFIYTHTDYIVKKYSSLLENYEKRHYVSTGTCRPFEKKVFVTANGKLLPCERIPQIYSMGEVDDHEVRFNFDRVADLYNKFYSHLKNMCNSCLNSEYCLQCILHLKECSPPSCPQFLNYEGYREKLRKALSLLEDTSQFYKRIMRYSEFK